MTDATALSFGVMTFALLATSVQPDTPKPSRSPARLQPQCMSAAEQMIGQSPILAGGKIREPQRTRYVAPIYPKQPSGTVGSGMWIGEALIDPSGAVRHVWVLAAPEFTPPWPAFSRAIVDSVRRWEYAPTAIAGRAVPVCVTITVNIDWK
jgi:hypothetical protein